jgi:hypothetical protein
MPKISLVVCLYKERDLLERLLQHADGCYDDLVVVHDGPETEGCPPTLLKDVHVPAHRHPEVAVDFSLSEQAAKASKWWNTLEGAPTPGSIYELVVKHGGRYFEGPLCWQQEPHWPFAWWAAKNDWILRLDADELPSEDLKIWLKEFRSAEEPEESISGFTCIWPPWDGKREVSRKIPEWRPFLFSRKRISYLGMAEQGPIPDQKWQNTGLVLHHRPKRKSYGPGNLLLRKQAYIWRKVIAQSLTKAPSNLPRWRWSSEKWPPYWEEITQSPCRAAIKRFLLSIPLEYIYTRRNGYDFIFEEAIGTALHKLLVPLAYWYYHFICNTGGCLVPRTAKKNRVVPSQNSA